MLKLRFSAPAALIAGLLFFNGDGFGQIGRGLPETVGQPTTGQNSVRQRTGDIMANPAATAPRKNIYLKREFEIPGREYRPQDPAAHFGRQIAPGQARSVSSTTSSSSSINTGPYTAQTLGLTFDGVTGPMQTGAFPPDSMGAVGPSQFFIFVNGRLETFNKTTGVADGALNADPDFFFSSVMTPANMNFTSDPQIRYDRLSGRWILAIIDVPSSSSRSIGDMPNRVLIAVSDAASNGVISANTVWSFFYVQQDMVGQPNNTSTGEFLDYDSLGVDSTALYIGGNMFDAVSGNFNGTSVFVVRKSSILNGGPIVVTAFRGLITGGDGPDSPRGVDNYDPVANEGYIIGPSDATFGRLVMRRFSTAGNSFRINAATTGRLSGDALGTVNAPALFTNSSSSYNVSDSSSPHRWGDYSFTSVDPDDDMTMWTIQEFCDGTNSYGLEVAKLLAPPPANPLSASSSVAAGQSSATVTINGSSASGSGFFDPGPGFAKR